MKHKIARITKDHKTATALVVLAAVAGVLVASAVGSGNMAFAGKGISIPTDTKQKQECQTAGATSLVTGSCTALSTNVVNQSGGVLSEEGK
jgi:flagellar basal body-associated protein FliL